MNEVCTASTLPAGLVYVADLSDGIRREARGDRFVYLCADGSRITSRTELERIAALAIPPAYSEVRISQNPRSHLQATGRDARGRKQYLYHPDWVAHRGETKFALLGRFAQHLPALRARVDNDLRRRKPDFEKALATVVYLLDNLFIRVGNEAYAEANHSYGLTTLRNRHVRLDGSEIRFRFTGKSGKFWKLSYSDRRIANAVRCLQELPGQHLFQYLDASGRPHPILSQDVNAYIRQGADEAFSTRLFRTWAATRLAAQILSSIEPDASQQRRRQQVNAAVDQVAARLMNTRTVCRASYIHPRILADFESGALVGLNRVRLSANSAARQWMDDNERRVMAWLLRDA